MPVRIDCAQEELQYIAMNGQEQTLKAEDMYMADGQGIISSVIYGPDGRTRIHKQTQRVLFVVYAPAGIQAQQIEAHFSDIQSYVKLFAPEANPVQQEIF